MINFCTLFDSNYLTRGLALHQSLQTACPDNFHLFVVAFDDKSYQYLKNAGLPHLTPISLKEFEDERLLAVKPSRSIAEYCWTSTSSVILYCIEKYNLPSCTYIDADMIFYHDPHVLIDEMGGKSFLISEHRYTKDYEQTGLTNGIYCVQFMYFKNDAHGMTALRWWRERCLEWCYDRLEDGKFGDQKYLDDWTTRFEGVHVMQHPGGGLAPWNIQQYEVTNPGGKLMVRLLGSETPVPAIFFHFHGLKIYTDDMASCAPSLYDIGPAVKQLIYKPYLVQLIATSERLKKEGHTMNSNGARSAAPSWSRTFLGFLKEQLAAAKSGRIPALRLKNYNFSRHYHFYKLKNLL